MSDRHTSNNMEPAWERRNAGRERLKALADSINSTAHKAWATLSFLFLAALYLGFTLLSSTDENLLLNAEVIVPPQVGADIPLKEIYAVGPWVLLGLHLLVLFWLSSLHQRMGRFEKILNHEIHNLQLTRQECWDWLSASPFVQRPRPNHHSPLFSRFLMWTSTEAISLVPLFIVTLSFVRYQSELITWMHKNIFILSLCSVILFNLSVSRIQFHPLRELPNQIALHWNFQKCIWALPRAMLAVLMTLILLIWAEPPTVNIASYEGSSKPLWEVMMEERDRIWRTPPNNRDMHQESKQHTNAGGRRSTSVEKVRWSIWLASKNSRWPAPLWTWMWENNILDAGPCEWWGFACRYLDAEDWAPDNNPLSLSGRNFRFANFRYAQLQGADLGSAQLQGANLESTNLQDALLTRTHMHGAFLFGANLRGAVFEWADLQGANLAMTRSQGANFAEAKLPNVSLKRADLQNAALVKANLQGADMEFARLDGARLWKADLKGARLHNAWLKGAHLSRVQLEGASLRNATLEGASLRNAKLQGTDIEGAQLNGVDLSDTKIQGSLGTPDSWDLAWPPNVWEYYSDEPDIASEEIDEAAEQEWRLFITALEKFPSGKFSIPSKYWNRLAVWTAQFACKNKYTARSSWNRWNSDEPLAYMKTSLNEEILDRVKRRILVLFLDGRKCEECAGLHDISDERWDRWWKESAAIRSAASRMHGDPDTHPVCREQHHPESTEERSAPPSLQ